MSATRSMFAPEKPLVVLYGYESSTFTLKVRLALKIKQIRYAFMTVPSMMPRPVLTDTFNLTYRKIPVLSIGRELYCDTAIICEALEQHFPVSDGYTTLYPLASDHRTYRGLIRGFASFWTDRPLFRATTGLIPASVWRTSFGKDRAQLIGHPLDAEKLEKKLPENLSRLDMHLSILEELLDDKSRWLLSTQSPSMADVSLWYQLKWGGDIAKGYLIDDLTAGGTPATSTEGIETVFNAVRYPYLYAWYHRFEHYMHGLDDVETRGSAMGDIVERMKILPFETPRLLASRPSISSLDRRCGLTAGALVSVTPDDTGRADPTIGVLLALTPEEVVIRPEHLASPPIVEVNIHFPRIGFVVRPIHSSKL